MNGSWLNPVSCAAAVAAELELEACPAAGTSGDRGEADVAAVRGPVQRVYETGRFRGSGHGLTEAHVRGVSARVLGLRVLALSRRRFGTRQLLARRFDFGADLRGSFALWRDRREPRTEQPASATIPISISRSRVVISRDCCRPAR